ncbi:hypothetical protein GCM10010193_37200 [Kitasatospora atroaurantiaca]
MGGGAAARLVVLCAVLAGLFLMHGSPSAAAGCHEAMAGMVRAAGTAEHPMAEHSVAEEQAPAEHAAAAAHHPAQGSVTCVSTQARGGVPLAGPGVLAALEPPLPTPAAVRSPAGTADGSRAPPAGRALLLQVCVSRT